MSFCFINKSLQDLMWTSLKCERNLTFNKNINKRNFLLKNIYAPGFLQIKTNCVSSVADPDPFGSVSL